MSRALLAVLTLACSATARAQDRYLDIDGGRTSRVFAEGAHLVLALPGDPYYRLFAASDHDFFLRTEASHIEFKRDASGTVVSMIIHGADGSATECPRV